MRTQRVNLFNAAEIVVDSFAGGGGASESARDVRERAGDMREEQSTMSDLRKQAERLVELDARLKGGEDWPNDDEFDEWEQLGRNTKKTVEFARAYLAECEAHEQTRNMMINYLRGVAKSCLECHGTGYLMQEFTPTNQSPKCYMCLVPRNLLASIEQKEGVSK